MLLARTPRLLLPPPNTIWHAATMYVTALSLLSCTLIVFWQALSLVEEGSDGLSARHRAIVHHAISVGHPWVSAIYDECKETGDVRGLMVRRRRGGGVGPCSSFSVIASAHSSCKLFHLFPVFRWAGCRAFNCLHFLKYPRLLLWVEGGLNALLLLPLRAALWF